VGGNVETFVALQPFQPGDPHYSGLRMVEIRTIPDSAPYSAAPALYRVPSVTSDFSRTIPGMRTI